MRAALNLAPKAWAKRAHLTYVNCDEPGYRRVGPAKRFSYVDPHGKTVRDAKTLKRIRSLVLPPAWKNVWICARPEGHLQATGIDARGRKQYRYHPKWSALRGETKYAKLIHFGRKLPKIRARIGQDLDKPGLPKEKVLATIVRLLETSLIRVGNEEYARDNQSFGLTTMKDKHAEIHGQEIQFHFKGKSGVKHAIDVRNPRLAKIVKKCQDIPGHDLFQYLDTDKQSHHITSSDVNEYLHEIAGEEFTAKDFRTWAGTVLAAQALKEFEAVDSNAQAKRNIVQAIESVAKKLGNTKAVCRKCYIHPAVLDCYLDGTLAEMLTKKIDREISQHLKSLSPEEAAVLAFLHKSLPQVTAPLA